MEGLDISPIGDPPLDDEDPLHPAIRCIEVVSRRHSIDIDGKIVSTSVSEVRTPRPDVNEMLANDSESSENSIENSTEKRRSFSNSVRSTIQYISVMLLP